MKYSFICEFSIFFLFSLNCCMSSLLVVHHPRELYENDLDEDFKDCAVFSHMETTQKGMIWHDMAWRTFVQASNFWSEYRTLSRKILDKAYKKITDKADQQMHRMWFNYFTITALPNRSDSRSNFDVCISNLSYKFIFRNFLFSSLKHIIKMIDMFF